MIHTECLGIRFTYQPIVCPDPLINGTYSVQEALQTLLRAEATCNPLLSKELPFCFSLISLSAMISDELTFLVFC